MKHAAAYLFSYRTVRKHDQAGIFHLKKSRTAEK